MYYILAVFKTRSETLYFANLLKSSGLAVSVINTPRQAGQACGICVKLLPYDLTKARALLATRHFQAFAGFYSVSVRNGMMVDFGQL